jgi:DNA invertase Pin-like site-specific DNA recombinase
MSIEAQLTELHELAKREGLIVIDELIEKQSAKIPGRPIFNRMLDSIDKGKANGILSWHPDRLARNSVDGGRIIYLIDTGKISALKFNTFWFEPTPQGKFMLSISFSQSKYYVDSLSENTRRGLRQKARNIYKSEQIYSTINGFWIEDTGLLNIVLEYKPQKYFSIGVLISGGTLLGCVGYLIYAEVKRRKLKIKNRE